jgi:UDP-N-acetylglucosamine--N-acetylmuramyl-(pentapeptide) pyrophosphoryl-undecaprenol N-acetylglucosamine transferase
MTDRRVYLFAGGGSGGHISPGLAIAERLVERQPDTGVVFACSSREIDRIMLRESGVSFETLPAAPLTLHPRGLSRFVRGYVRSRNAAIGLMKSRGVSHVVALGGFVSAPVVAAAARLRIHSTLVNLDDPPGKANRWIARRCTQVLSAVRVSRRPGFAREVTGMPIRRHAMAPGPPEDCRRRLGLDPDAPTLLVTGASQGARSINTLVTSLAGDEPALFDGWQVVHLSGRSERDKVERAWADAGIRAWVRPFVHEMGPVWGSADLAVSRAGASSVAEAWANHVPTVFMPYPWHRDRHQERNARPMADAGGAVIERDHVDVAANLAGVGRTLRALMLDAAGRQAMRQRLRDQPAPDGADNAARMLMGCVSDADAQATA